jgi:glucokinase
LSTAIHAVEETAGELALVADIGGTNARFALAPLHGKRSISELRKWRVADYPTLADAARAFIEETAPDNPPRVGMVAVAAPSNRDEVRMTNCKWQFSVSETKRLLGFDHLQVINDFAANSWAMLDLPDAELLQLGDRRLADKRVGTFAALGPGTGLGVGAVRRTADGELAVIETEGGHIDFAPVSEEEDKVLVHLRKRFGRVSYERLLCGTGLVNLYDAVTQKGLGITPEEITRRAAEGDAETHRIVEMFCEILGSFAGNVALMHGAWDGVFLSGCMLREMADTLASGGFRQRFETKGRFSGMLAEIPTALVQQPSLGLLGSAAALRSRLETK